MKYVAIIVAEDEEVMAIKNIFTELSEIKIYNMTVYSGKVNGLYCLLVQSGVGKVNAGRTAQILIDKFDVGAVINTGVGGATEEALNIGDVVISTGLIQHDFDVTAFGREKGFVSGVGKVFEADKHLIYLCENALNLCGIHYKKGIIATWDKFVNSKEEKLKLKSEFDAKCVEMEGAAIAHVCRLCGVPFVAIRSISDGLAGNAKVDFEQFLEKASKKCAEALKIVLADFI